MWNSVMCMNEVYFSFFGEFNNFADHREVIWGVFKERIVICFDFVEVNIFCERC